MTDRQVSHLLQLVGLLDGLQNTLLGRLLGLSAQQELVQDEVGLLKVKYDVQLTHLSRTKTNITFRSCENLADSTMRTV